MSFFSDAFLKTDTYRAQNSDEEGVKREGEKVEAHPSTTLFSSSSSHTTNESHLRCLEGRSPSVSRRRVEQPRILCRLCSPRQHKKQNNFGKPWTCLGRRETFNRNSGCSDIFFDLGRFGYHGRIVAGADIGRATPSPGIRLRRLRRARRKRSFFPVVVVIT